MADTKLSALTATTDIDDSDLIYVTDGGTSRKMTRADFIADATANILTAIKTVDGTGSGLDADLLDGQEATAFATAAQGSTADSAMQDLVDDTTPQLGGDLDGQGNAIDDVNIGATTPGTGGFTGLDLAAIAETKGVTAVDVFLYDTSQDSDGGAWRKRCQHTSWYNDTLDTASRGSTREPPAVMPLIAQTSTLTAYDGDNPDVPMWKVWDFTGFTITSVKAMNGQIVVGTTTGVVILDLVADGIDVALTYSTSTSPAIVNNSVKSVAITVRPDAPIDPATGLPVPTIAVATDGGVSVINNDGTVADSTQTVGMLAVAWGANNRLFYNDDSSDQTYYADTYAADGFNSGGDHYDTDAAPYTLPGNVTSLTGDVMGHADGLTFLHEDQATKASGMAAFVTKDYATGWMQGNIKGAFLSDTDDTDLVGGELVTNGTFDTDTSGWIFSGTATDSSSAGYLEGSTATNNTLAYTSITTVAGSTYTVQMDVVSATATAAIMAGTTAFGSTLGTSNYVAAGNTATFTFVATGSLTYISARSNSVPHTVRVDNISVKLAGADRSVNNKGLIVNGTITRTAVNSGAELVAYSGFSASNYLEQLYNSDLDFGTGDFCVMGWIKEAANSAVETILERDSASTAQRWTVDIDASGFLRFTCDDNTTVRTATSNVAIDTDTWTHFVAVYDGDGDLLIYLNGALDDTESGSALLTLNNASAVLNIGLAVDGADPNTNGSLALARISATVPSAEQIRKIYEDEKHLFQANAACTLYGTSDAVTALAHDPITDLLHVGTSFGRSVFQGLSRVSNTTTAVSAAISANDGMVIEQ